MDNSVKDIVQLGSLAVASIGGIIAAFRAILEMDRNRKQRIKELRWQQAREAKKLTDELYTNHYSRDAIRMLDLGGRQYKITENLQQIITTEDVLNGLRISNLTFSPKEIFIRDCFNEFLDILEDIWIFISVDLITFEDTKPIVDYYVKIMAENITVYKSFMKEYKFHNALALFERFDSWKRRL